jgi:hypothetical protein
MLNNLSNWRLCYNTCLKNILTCYDLCMCVCLLPSFCIVFPTLSFVCPVTITPPLPSQLFSVLKHWIEFHIYPSDGIPNTEVPYVPRFYIGWSKSLCTWWLQYRKLQVMFKVSPTSLQTFINTRLTLLPSVMSNSNYVIMVSNWNCLWYFCVFFVL